MTTPDRDRALLQQYEPILRFTRGEHFFPVDVYEYVAHCSLWRQLPGREAECLLPAGELTIEKLGEFAPREQLGGGQIVYFLKFVDPLTMVELVTHTRQQRAQDKRRKNLFQPGSGRLARVGYFSRLVDALFSLALLARGRVSGDTSAAATIFYERTRGQEPRFAYHGRVIRQGEWLVLQYWFFYYFNNWRSGFFGANDHEADWEMVAIYLSENPDNNTNASTTPEWVAYASHDYTGDDLRRHWHDPELERHGDHPVIYAGAGSHASYYTAGEYVTELTLPFLRPIVRLSNRLKRIWRTQLRQYTYINDQEPHSPGEKISIFQIPFVDYARGDGQSIGPGQSQPWTDPILLDPPPPWVQNYRGLWGLYTQDPLSGEDAPAGPMYDRDGSVRRAWYDPLGWAGLDKVPPSHKATAVLETQISRLQTAQADLRTQAADKATLLQGLGLEVQALARQPDLHTLLRPYEQQLKTLTSERHDLEERIAHNDLVLRALHDQKTHLEAGNLPPLRAHIKRAHRPTSNAEMETSRMAEIWAAISIAVLLLSIVVLFFLERNFIIVGTISIIFLVSLIEAAFRRRLINFLNNTAVVLAFIASLILLYEFFLQWLIMAVIIAGLYLLFINIRELRT